MHLVTISTGNVGIGTTAPTAALDVSGNLKVSGTIDIHQNYSPLKSAQILTESLTIVLDSYSQRVATVGNVGIGFTVPSAKREVTGPVKIGSGGSAISMIRTITIGDCPPGNGGSSVTVSFATAFTAISFVRFNDQNRELHAACIGWVNLQTNTR